MNGRFVDLPAIGGAVARLPIVHRILLENVARTQSGSQRESSIHALLDWEKHATSEAEIEVQPVRVLMHDTANVLFLTQLYGQN